ncbi:proline-rich domain-containing protein [Bacillus cereus]|nr:proline-rich domain-containing protein [Bacillus cereus]
MPFVNMRLVFADGPSIQLLGSKGVTVDNKGISLSLKVTDAKDIVTFQLSELMLVNDCSFNFGLTKWVRPSQKENQFDINIKENGTYAFYIFSNGKVKGYVRFKATGFPQNAQGGGVTQYWGEGAKYYELPEEAVNPDDFRDYDGKNDGICTNEKLPDKPHGSGEIEEPKEEDKNQGGNNGDNKDWMKELMNKLNEIGGKVDKVGDKIPPPPDWDKVADTFVDKISPQLKKDLKEVFGEAPDPPSPPPLPPETDTKGLDKYEPDFQDNQKLKESGFTADDIKDGAEEIKFNQDESGGFDIKDPVGSLPDVPKDLPKPGETEKSEWSKNKPKEPEPSQKPIPKPPDDKPIIDNPKPKEDSFKPPKPKEDNGGFPKPKPDGDGGFPKPKPNGGEPPKPNIDTGTPPKPKPDGGNPPKPNTGGEDKTHGNYKRTPDAPDGSG